MMNIRTALQWCEQKIRNYNLFVPDENDYDDDDEIIIDAAFVVSRQKYATWLYILFLTCE